MCGTEERENEREREAMRAKKEEWDGKGQCIDQYEQSTHNGYDYENIKMKLIIFT